MNHTLSGDKISSSKVVCRDRWGTPMPPDGKGGYSLIAPVKGSLIKESLWIPPVSGSRPKTLLPPPAAAKASEKAPAKAGETSSQAVSLPATQAIPAGSTTP
jgi:hypothetical protein